ncbi:MAG: cell division protein ZapE, partial [Pseudomonadota bacterium]
GGVDYRLRALEQAEIYHFPLDATATESLRTSFTSISPDDGQAEAVLNINGRNLQTIREGDGIVWFDFEVICNSPRSVSDYIELAKCYNTVLISDVPVMSETSEDAALRFVQLVDEFYDRNVKLILSAEAYSDGLYQGKKHAFAFERTHSRLEEMQSHEYLERPHLP